MLLVMETIEVLQRASGMVRKWWFAAALVATLSVLLVAFAWRGGRSHGSVSPDAIALADDASRDPARTRPGVTDARTEASRGHEVVSDTPERLAVADGGGTSIDDGRGAADAPSLAEPESPQRFDRAAIGADWSHGSSLASGGSSPSSAGIGSSGSGEHASPEGFSAGGAGPASPSPSASQHPANSTSTPGTGPAVSSRSGDSRQIAPVVSTFVTDGASDTPPDVPAPPGAAGPDVIQEIAAPPVPPPTGNAATRTNTATAAATIPEPGVPALLGLALAAALVRRRRRS
jgi:hypothetical protein